MSTSLVIYIKDILEGVFHRRADVRIYHPSFASEYEIVATLEREAGAQTTIPEHMTKEIDEVAVRDQITSYLVRTLSERLLESEAKRISTLSTRSKISPDWGIERRYIGGPQWGKSEALMRGFSAMSESMKLDSQTVRWFQEEVANLGNGDKFPQIDTAVDLAAELDEVVRDQTEGDWA